MNRILVFSAGLMAAACSVVAADERPEPRGDAWLGVQLAPVPPPLAAHLQLEGKGLMVQNVFVSSPADRAGLDQFDVIIQVDGKPVENDIRAFAEHVQSHQPGERIELRVYRHGEQAPAHVIELGKAPEHPGDFKLKFDDPMPDVLRFRDLGVRGRILRPGEAGGWIMEDLGDLPRENWERFFFDEAVRAPLPPGAVMDEGRFVAGDGSSIHVRRDEDGTFTVTRKPRGDGGEKEQKKYRNLEELREQDPEACRLVCPEPDGHGPRRHLRDRTQRLPGPPPGASADRWREWGQRFFQAPLWEREDAPRREMSPPGSPAPPPDARERRDGDEPNRPRREAAPPGMGPGTTPPAPPPPREGRPGGGGQGGDPMQGRPPMGGGGMGMARGQPRDDTRPSVAPPPRSRASETNFEVNLDGTITVHVEDEQGSLTRTFKSREDLARQAPQLFGRLERIESRMR